MVLSTALALGLAGGAASAAPAPTPSATNATGATAAPTSTAGTPAVTGTSGAPTSTQPADSDVPPTISPDELRKQIAAADALRAELLSSSAEIAESAARLERLAVQANGLLEAYATAQAAERKARAEADRNVRRFELLTTQLIEDRRALGEWAYSAYAGSGGSLGDMSAMLEVLSKPAEEASDTAAQLSYLSDQRTGAYERVRDNVVLQRDAAARAVEASTEATEEAAKAAAAKKKLDGVVAAQKAQLAATRSLHQERVEDVGPISGLLVGSGDEDAFEATKKLHEAAGLAPPVPKPVASPEVIATLALTGARTMALCSDDEAEYPNGRIPESALCPLDGDPTERLRPGGAAAFNALSKAYERDTGTPICIVDGYRSYDEQVTVKAERGSWAATPGTSEHGMGRAVDLCGGIENFGTPAHLWMKQNAPLFGWFHPAWAAPGGSLPEPWHWEYAG